MSTLNDWDIVDANNDDAPPDGWPEDTMDYSDVNDAGRAVQGTLKRYFADVNGSLVAGGVADAYTVTLNETGYLAYFTGMYFACKINATNTGASTMNVNAIGVKDIVDRAGNALGAGEITSGGIYEFRYDGADMQLMGTLIGSQTIGGSLTVAGAINANGVINAAKSIHGAKGADVASATALPLIADGNIVDVTGTTTITSMNSVGIGTWMIMHFDGALILTHDNTALDLPGQANITTVVGDEAIFYEYSSGNWRCVNYQRTQNPPVLNARVNTKVIDIGDWDMDGTISITVAHGLTLANIRNISVLIRTDADDAYYDFFSTNPTGNKSQHLYADATNIVMQRENTGVFDNTNYNSTSYNRGWITIQYI